MTSVTYFLIFLLHTTSVYTSEVCPEVCRCTKDDETGKTNVICERLTSLPASFPKTTSQLQILSSTLSTIPPRAFSNSPEIQSIYVRFSAIENVSADAFSNLHNLSDVEFQRNNITQIEPFAFNDLSVSSLTLSDNSIDVIKSHAFTRIAADEQIVCSNNVIGELNTASFTDVIKAKVFQFQMNTVQLVKENCFTKFLSVGMFDFSNNHFQHVESQEFDLLIKPIFFKNDLSCDCQISWIFDTPLFAQYTEINYCDVNHTVSLQEWNRRNQTFCEPLTVPEVTIGLPPSTGSMLPKPSSAIQGASQPSVITSMSSPAQNVITMSFTPKSSKADTTDKHEPTMSVTKPRELTPPLNTDEIISNPGAVEKSTILNSLEKSSSSILAVGKTPNSIETISTMPITDDADKRSTDHARQSDNNNGGRAISPVAGILIYLVLVVNIFVIL